MSIAIRNRAIIAAAGSRKTEHIVESALAVTDGRVLITTYTEENQRQIIRRIEQKVGTIPRNITVMGWFTFLIAHCAKPYQRAITGEPFVINGLNFNGIRSWYIKKGDVRYFIDKNGDMYRDWVADFVVTLDAKTGGAVIGRLRRIFRHIFIDEVQDLVGFDLDVLALLLNSGIEIALVGDPRQAILETSMVPRNRKYRGEGLLKWFAERRKLCALEVRSECYRCNQAICDFADAIFPSMPSTTSVGVDATGHDGIFQITRSEVACYVAKYHPVTVIRYAKNSDTAGLPAMNIGVSKGSTFDRVVIFPTKPMLQYLKHRDATKLKTPEKLYVAVTRARFSLAFVVPDPK